MSNAEVQKPIINSPYEEPTKYWKISPHDAAQQIEERRPPTYLYTLPNTKGQESNSEEVNLELVAAVRHQLALWRPLALRGEGGITRVSMDLLNYWRREGREHQLFFAQLEAAETIIFLNEARSDFLQGINIPLEQLSKEQQDKGLRAFKRLCCKMATGSGKTTVMAMLAAWSILNKVNNKRDNRFSNAVLVVCPNVTIRDRLAELDPQRGEASIYRSRDLVPPAMMPQLAQGKVLVTNWHVFEPQSSSSAKVVKTGKRVVTRETITIGSKKDTLRGKRYLTENELRKQQALGYIKIISENTNKDGSLKSVEAESIKYVESDRALVERLLKRPFGGQKNILVFNDEAHHAYRLQNNAEEEKTTGTEVLGEAEEVEYYEKQATLWVEGLDKINTLRGINQCFDFSATPYFLQRAGEHTNRVFPWTVSNFGLQDAIESGLVKVPQLAVRDSSGARVPGYANIWNWVIEKLTPAERGGKISEAKPEAILKYAHTPIAMMGGMWDKEREEWAQTDEKRPPVFIIVCKTTKLAKMMYEWLAEDSPPSNIPKINIPSLLNSEDCINTIRVDSKVKHESESGSKDKEGRWMRHTLDTIGKTTWQCDSQGRPIYPDGFRELVESDWGREKKLGKFLEYPPGRDIRCIISVGMLTEGWDCNTVTHIIGLRPFMSQLLCEQVIGRGLRRASYAVGEDGLFGEEIATVLGVPLTTFPIKATGKGTTRAKKYRIYAMPQRQHYEITFPRVEGYRQKIEYRVTCDIENMPSLSIDPTQIPPEVEMKAGLPDNQGRVSLHGPGAVNSVGLAEFRANYRRQARVFEVTEKLVKHFNSQECKVPDNILFGQIYRIVNTYISNKVEVSGEAMLSDVFMAPYYGWTIEQLRENIKPCASSGELPELPRYELNRPAGSSGDVDFWTGREPYNVIKSHVNAVVPDTKKLEQATAYALDKNSAVEAFVKNEHMGFAIPYFHNGQMHDYLPDFIVRLTNEVQLILETKGYDKVKEIKVNAAKRWVNAVNADNQHGKWQYAIIAEVKELNKAISKVLNTDK